MTDTKEAPTDLIGAEFVLWRREWRQTATTSSRVGTNDGYVVLEQLGVTVFEQRDDVPGKYDPDARYTGLKTTTADGRTFALNWESYPDDAHTGATLYWAPLTDADRAQKGQFVDAIQAYSSFYRAIGGQYYDERGEFMVPVGATICPRHGDAFLPGQECVECKFDRSLITNGLGAVTYIGCPFCPAVRRDGDRDSSQRVLHLRWDHPREFLEWENAGREHRDWTQKL